MCFSSRHPIIKKLSMLSTTNVKLAELVTKQVRQYMGTYFRVLKVQTACVSKIICTCLCNIAIQISERESQ
jgi:hypothetical protein